jgi:FMN phosphatase YigB (HAD superfamily)
MAFFFDLDGTLIDHSAAQDRGLEALSKFNEEYRIRQRGSGFRTHPAAAQMSRTRGVHR